MSAAEKFPEIMKAAALGDAERAKVLMADLSADEHAELFVFETAVMSVCLVERLGSSPGLDEIRQFVHEMRYDYAEMDPPLNPLMIEGYIRAFCGEEHLMDDIPEEEQMAAQMPVIRKVVAQSPELQGRIDSLMSEAAAMVEQWRAEA